MRERQIVLRRILGARPLCRQPVTPGGSPPPSPGPNKVLLGRLLRFQLDSRARFGRSLTLRSVHHTASRLLVTAAVRDPPFGAGSSPCSMIAKAVQNRSIWCAGQLVRACGDDGPCKAQDRLLLHALALTEPRPLRPQQ